MEASLWPPERQRERKSVDFAALRAVAGKMPYQEKSSVEIVPEMSDSGY